MNHGKKLKRIKKAKKRGEKLTEEKEDRKKRILENKKIDTTGRRESWLLVTLLSMET